MALTSPGVEVTIIDQSQYLPAPTNSVPLVVLATAQNKADPTGTGVAAATTAANAGKLYQVTSQRDLVTLYGNPFFYNTTNGTPIQGYELNEYGLLAAYSLLGVTNRCYVLRADIDLSTLVGKTGRPTGNPDNGTWWLDTTTSSWGIFEFNSTTGQFSYQTPIVITDSAYISAGAPIASIGNIGDYAVNALQITTYPSASTAGEYFYKTTNNTWVKVGGELWMGDWPTIQGTQSNPTLTTGSFNLNLDADFSVTISITAGDSVQDVADQITALGWTYLTANVRDGKLCVYSKQIVAQPIGTKFINISTPVGTVLAELGIAIGDYYQPALSIGTSAQQPLWQAGQFAPRPTGSVWIKVGAVGTGLAPVVSQFNSTLGAWKAKTVSMATSDWTASASLDSSGGQAIPAGTVYGQYYFDAAYASGPVYLWERTATGSTVVTGTVADPTFTNGPYTATVYVSVPGSTSLSAGYSFSLADTTDATAFVTAWSAAGVPNTTATLTTDLAIQLTHTEGGEIIIEEPNGGTLCADAGFIVGDTAGVKYGPSVLESYDAVNGHGGSGTNLQCGITVQYGTYNLAPATFSNAGTGYTVGNTITFYGADLGGATPTNNLVAQVTQIGVGGSVQGITFISGTPVENYATQLSNWVEFTYTSNEGAPVAAPANNENWFYSVTDQVDIMVNALGQWNGYAQVGYDSNGFPSPTATPGLTDPNGPIVSASEPTTQSDGTTALAYGDLWISTADLENYPVISRWQAVGEPGSQVDQWVLLDNSDQTSSKGVLFADARWAQNGDVSPTDDPIPTIVTLLSSDYIDLDCPAPSLHPTGMLLFNTRRSGYNVKQYKVNYFSNANFPGQVLPTQTSAWVSESGLQSNGAPYMGRKAQRAMVVQSLRSVIDTNQAIRDEDNFFNLMATPNYPELQPNMVVLNADRGETGYILGDTPLGLPNSATDIQAWATNAAGATSTGEEGCVTRNTYLGLFYPSGITSDLSGNLVAVPASHMMLRTFLKNDTISYPWLAAAGTRRGIIDNATNIGYLDRTTGEFQTIKTSVGIRDVLYINFINPLVFFTGNGLLNYGNKTSYNSSSALDRTNVARLVAYIRRQLTLAARPFVFEPNDQLTRQQIAGVVESLMIDLVAKRGIYDYLVVCDESNNTPARIDRNELWIDVAVEPVKAAEFIYIPVRILNTGELKSL